MISNENGVKLRLFEMERQEKIKKLLNGAILTDVIFDDGIGLSGKEISGLILLKGDETYSVSINAEQYYEVTETKLLITSQSGQGKEVEKLIVMPTPCDKCNKSNCKDRSTPGNWVVDCKEQEK
jgi:hypothetical protein